MAKATNKKVRHKFKLYFYTKTKVQSEKAEKAEKAAEKASKVAVIVAFVSSCFHSMSLTQVT
jgi:N-acetylmuramic acid 6-phosphate (MurNAc-6-P) etherase